MLSPLRPEQAAPPAEIPHIQTSRRSRLSPQESEPLHRFSRQRPAPSTPQSMPSGAPKNPDSSPASREPRNFLSPHPIPFPARAKPAPANYPQGSHRPQGLPFETLLGSRVTISRLRWRDLLQLKGRPVPFESRRYSPSLPSAFAWRSIHCTCHERRLSHPQQWIRPLSCIERKQSRSGRRSASTILQPAGTSCGRPSNPPASAGLLPGCKSPYWLVPGRRFPAMPRVRTPAFFSLLADRLAEEYGQRHCPEPRPHCAYPRPPGTSTALHST